MTIHPAAIVHNTSLVHPRVHVGEAARIGARVLFEDDDASITTVERNATIGAGAIIGAGVNVGRGAEVRPGCVVLQSVPPNAIIEGNPAKIVGYTQGRAPSVVNAAPQGMPNVGPSLQRLGIGEAALHRMRRITDLRGSLTVGDVERELPFIPRRYFIVFGVPSRELRGEHAHKECAQFLICVAGSCRLMLDDGRARCEVTLDRPDLGAYMPPRLWGTQYQFSNDAVLLVFASHLYDPNDYLRTYDEFLAYIGQNL
jgi:UDP-2-acetamido-3-amino-2,3-dideoxy-glucuronate N-acetyltransferase